MEAWNQLAASLAAAVGTWRVVPADFWGVLWPLFLITVSAYPMVVGCRTLRDNISSRLDRWLLAPLFGMAYYTVLFSAANALLGVPIGATSFYVAFTLTSAVGYGWMARGRIDWRGHWQRGHWGVVAGLLLILVLAGAARFAMSVKYPDRLLDSDPYRHFPRAQWVVETGDIARWEPWLAGEVPIYEVQGCYVLAALLTTVGRVDAYWVWKYGSILMGALSAVAFYLFASYFVPGRPRRFVGLLAAGFVASFAVHITRTNMGFSEAWSLVYLPVALLMILWSFRYDSVAAGALYGVFVLGIAASNMIPVSMAMVFLLPYCAYQLLRRSAPPLWRAALARSAKGPSGSPEPHWTRDLARAFGGLGLGIVVFFAFIGIWQTTWAGVPINVGARAHSVENMSIMKGVFRKEEDKAREKAEGDPNLPAIHRLLAGGLGWHNTKILELYMGHRTAVWGVLALSFVLLVPAARSRGAESSAKPSRPSLAVGGEPRGQWLDARVFLLLFALLPLLEFALLPVLMRDDALGMADIRDGDRLIEQLRADGPENAAPLRPRLSENSRQLLSQHQFPGPWSEPLLEALLDDLNRVIEGPPLDIDGGEWRGVEFRLKTRELHSGALEEDDRPYFNRLVIEDVFPEEIARRDWMGFRFRTFTGRTYRYLLMPAYGLSLAMAIALGMLVDLVTGLLARLDRRTATPQKRERSLGSRAVRWPGRLRSTLMVLAFALLCSHLLYAKGYGNWPPTSKPSEERALQWMVENLPDDARIVCNWFNADFVRSYSARAERPMLSIFAGTRNRPGLRLNVRAAVEPGGLEIPELTSSDEILEFAEQNPGTYYVMKTRFGPWLPVEKEPEHFRLIATFSGGRNPIETVRIFELTTNRVRVDPKE